MSKHEKALRLITVNCWLTEMDRLINWVQSSGASRKEIATAISESKKSLQSIDRSRLSTSVNGLIEAKILKLSRAGNRSKRSRRAMDLAPFTVLVPCERDLVGMQHMPAGTVDDQFRRIQKIKDMVHDAFPKDRVVETGGMHADFWIDRVPWAVLCEVITRQEPDLLDMAFSAIPKDNPVLTALLYAHSRDYLLRIMRHCAGLGTGEFSELTPGDSDVVVGPRTFEIFINDFISTLEQRRFFNVSFGLPSHHASRDKAGGFCVFNKIAALAGYEQLTREELVHHVVVGLDVNQDNGTRRIFWEQSGFPLPEKKDMFITHYDVNDPRAFPGQAASDIGEEWGQSGSGENHMTTWRHEGYCYNHIDLSSKSLRRKAGGIHPAMERVLSELETTLLIATTMLNERVTLYLPTGWDSHVEEAAAAGTWLNGKAWIKPGERKTCRFNDADWAYFNQHLVDLLQRYEANIHCVYFQLEGGYTDAVNSRQIAALAQTMVDFHKKARVDVSVSGSSSSSTAPGENGSGRVLRRHR